MYNIGFAVGFPVADLDELGTLDAYNNWRRNSPSRKKEKDPDMVDGHDMTTKEGKNNQHQDQAFMYMDKAAKEWNNEKKGIKPYSEIGRLLGDESEEFKKKSEDVKSAKENREKVTNRLADAQKEVMRCQEALTRNKALTKEASEKASSLEEEKEGKVRDAMESKKKTDSKVVEAYRLKSEKDLLLKKANENYDRKSEQIKKTEEYLSSKESQKKEAEEEVQRLNNLKKPLSESDQHQLDMMTEKSAGVDKEISLVRQNAALPEQNKELEELKTAKNEAEQSAATAESTVAPARAAAEAATQKVEGARSDLSIAKKVSGEARQRDLGSKRNWGKAAAELRKAKTNLEEERDNLGVTNENVKHAETERNVASKAAGYESYDDMRVKQKAREIAASKSWFEKRGRAINGKGFTSEKRKSGRGKPKLLRVT